MKYILLDYSGDDLLLEKKKMAYESVPHLKQINYLK